jgi:hypothetical protein
MRFHHRGTLGLAAVVVGALVAVIGVAPSNGSPSVAPPIDIIERALTAAT